MIRKCDKNPWNNSPLLKQGTWWVVHAYRVHSILLPIWQRFFPTTAEHGGSLDSWTRIFLLFLALDLPMQPDPLFYLLRLATP